MSGEKVVPIHQWTNEGGEVLVLRYVTAEGRSYGGFQSPVTVGEFLTVPDEWDSAWGRQPDDWRPGWIPDEKCGGGIHGWAWGLGLGDGKDPDWSALWQVYAVQPEDVVADVGAGPKVKFRSGVLRYSGDWHGAFLFLLPGQMAWVFAASSSAASNSGYSGAASNSGDSGAASNSGYRGAASNSGYSGAASNSGYSGAASNSGDRGAATSTGEASSAESSAPGTAATVTGLNGRARAGEFGSIALAWWNPKAERVEMRCAQIGGLKRPKAGALKPDTWYRLNAKGQFVEES